MELSQTDLQAFEAFERSGWEKAADPYHLHWGMLSQQSAVPMLDAAAVVDGEHVLDVATGAGYVAAAAVKRGAYATGIDFSKAQVELARQTYLDIEFHEGNAENLEFEANTFDAVVIGFGVNHLPNPDAAFSEAFRVLKPGGRFAFTVWAAPEPDTGFGIVLSAIEQHGSSDVQLPPAPPYFRFADEHDVRLTFEQAGFVRPKTEIVPQVWHHDRPDDLFNAFNEGAVRATAMLRSQSDRAREEIKSAMRHEVLRFQQGDKYIIPVPAALSSAHKPY